jgi:hypothetical protein
MPDFEPKPREKVGKGAGRKRGWRRRRRRRATAGTAASGSIGTSIAFVVVVVVGEVPDGGVFPWLLEPGAFFGLLDDAPVGFAVVDEFGDFPVVAVEDVVAVDRPVVGVVDRRVVEVVDEAVVVVVGPAAAGPVVVVDEAAVAWACVTGMLRWPSVESELPSGLRVSCPAGLERSEKVIASFSGSQPSLASEPAAWRFWGTATVPSFTWGALLITTLARTVAGLLTSPSLSITT